MNERERLNEIVAQLWCFPQHSSKHMDIELAHSIIELILADRRRCLEEVEKPLEKCLRGNLSDEDAVDEAIAKIKELKNEKNH